MKMDFADLTLDPEMRRRFLARCPDLAREEQDISPALAAKFELVKYDRDHSFDEALEVRPLRVILLGHVSLVQRRGREQVTRSCGPMATFGEESVKAWNDARIAGSGPSVDNVTAITKSVTYVLELARAQFDEVLGAPKGEDDPLLARLLCAYDVHDIAPEIVEALGQRPELVEVDNEGLYQLLEGAEIRNVHAGEMLAPAGVVPASFFVLLDRGNSFELRTPGKSAGQYDVSTVPAPSCSGLAYLIKGMPLEAAIHVQREGKVVALSDDAFWGLFKFNTDFQRAIIRSNGLDADAGKGGRPKIDPSATSIFLMLQAMQREANQPELPMRGLTDLLAESIVTHLYDNVLVVHAVPKPAAGQATTARADVRLDMPGGTWLEHAWVEIDTSLVQDLIAARERRAATLDDQDHRPDVTLIEVSELVNTPRFLRDFDKIDTQFKVVHVSDRPDSLPPIPLIAAGASILYTGLLDTTPPLFGVGAAAHGAQGSGATRTTIDVTMSAAKNVATFAKRLVQGLKEAQATALGHLPAAWPLGTVRLRLPQALLDALAPAPGKPTASFASLGVDEALTKAARLTIDRWARAVTRRRVGLALGGGGTYGDVHVPFIKALADEDVPIDMVSGSSVGSTIGAYYCGLGKAGLDLYWKHRSMLLAAGSVGFISSAAVEVAIVYDLGQLQLDQTEIPFFPVVTDADVGVESYLSKGTFAFGVRASGSLPPLLGPTVQGDRRYLDGGLVANVPVNVLTAEGAALIIASNPIAKLAHRPRKQPFNLPLFGVLLRESSPFTRLDDAVRMVPMIFGVAGQSQAAHADVMYRPASTDASLTMSHDPHFEQNARESVTLRKAVAAAVNKWRASLGHPPSRVTITTGKEGRSLSVDGWLGFVGASGTIDPESVPLLVEVAGFLVKHPEVLAMQVVVSSPSGATARKQADRVKSLLEENGVQPERVTAVGLEVRPAVVAASDAKPSAPEPRAQITFPITGFEAVKEEQAKLLAALEDAKRALLDADRRADGETLTLGAKDRAASGDLDLAGLLAIEAAKLTRSPNVDEALRQVLARRGQMERSIAVDRSGEARRVAWSPDGDLLAVGTCDGKVRIWDARVAHSAPLGTIDHGQGGTDKAILGVAFSADGRRIIAAGLDSEASVHEVIRGPGNSFELKPIFQSFVGTWDQWGVALSPGGGQALLTWGSRSDLAIFDVGAASSEPIHVLKGKTSCQHAAWEPDGDRVAAAMSDGSVVIWSASTGAALETIVTGEHGPARVAWHPRGGALLVACEETAAVHDLAAAPGARAKPVVLDGHRRQIIGLAWSEDGSRVVTTSRDLTARIWDAKAGTFQMSLRSIRGHFVGAAFRSGSVKVVATWNELGAIGIWDAETGERRTTLGGHTGSISDAKWSPDGERLATASTDATTRLWAPEKIGQVVYLGHLECRKPRIVAVQLSPSGSDQVVTAGVNGCAHVWRASDGARLAVLTSASIEAGPADARFSPKGDLIAVTQARVATPLLFTTSDLRAAVTLATPPRRDDEPMVDPQQIRWSPDGSRVAVKQSKGLVVWSATSGAIERVIVSARPTMSMCWNPTGDRLALALWTRGDAVEIWDAAGDAPPRARLGGYADGIWSVDWSADGRHVATACNTAIACVHDAESGARLTTREHGAAVKVVALSPDGRWLATGDDAKALTVWEWAVEGSLPANGPSAHGSRIAQITWSADSSRLVSMSEDGLVCLWERRGSGAGTRFVHVATVRNTHCRNEVVASSPDGKWLVTGDDEGAAMIHPVAMDDLVEAVRRRLGRSALTDAEWTQYLPRRRPPQAAATKG